MTNLVVTELIIGGALLTTARSRLADWVVVVAVSLQLTGNVLGCFAMIDAGIRVHECITISVAPDNEIKPLGCCDGSYCDNSL